MKTLVCLSPGSIVVEERPEPGPLVPGWVLLEIAFAGICGTDYHIYEGKHPFLNYPRVIGHELSATIRDPNGASGLNVGDAVVVNPYLACGSCIACRQDKPNCCMTLEVLGVHRDGGMCGLLAVPAGNVIPAAGLSLRDAALVEFLAIGAHAVRRAGRSSGRAMVIGAGPIGLGVALFARIAGLEVSILDLSDDRLAQARDILGDVRTLDPAGAAAELSGFETVFDATGAARSIEAGFQYVAHGGTYVLVSVVRDEIRFSDPEFHKREMSLLGSRNATSDDFLAVIDAIRSGQIPVDRLVTHETTLEDAQRNLPHWASNKQGLVKALVKIRP